MAWVGIAGLLALPEPDPKPDWLAFEETPPDDDAEALAEEDALPEPCSRLLCVVWLD